MVGEPILVWVSIIVGVVSLVGTIGGGAWLLATIRNIQETQQKAIDHLWQKMEEAVGDEATRVKDHNLRNSDMRLLLEEMRGEISGKMKELGGEMKVIDVRMSQIAKDRDLSGVLIETLQHLSKQRVGVDHG